jgi:hypothetical protein
MTARQNYGFERRRRDQLRRAKQEEKRLRKSERAESGEAGPEMGEAPESAAPQGVWEWFSPSRSRTVTTATGSRPDPEEPDDWILLTETAQESEPPS